MLKAKTHFEQIPVEVVKKIVEQKESQDQEMDNIKVERPTAKTEPYGVGHRFANRAWEQW